MSSPSKRREMDVMKLMMSDYKVDMVNDGMSEFFVEFRGPRDCALHMSDPSCRLDSVRHSRSKSPACFTTSGCWQRAFSCGFFSVLTSASVLTQRFLGNIDGPYQNGVWKVRVELPDAYPYKSPSIGFVNRIFHPNVDEMSGSVCLDVINQTWSPMFDLLNVFEVFLPQLLLYPNPTDPLNGEAAALMMRNREQYDQKVKEYCDRYAKPEDVNTPEGDNSDTELSDEGYVSSEEEMAGHADP